MSFTKLTVAEALPRLTANDPTLTHLRFNNVAIFSFSPCVDREVLVPSYLRFLSSRRIIGKCGDVGVRQLGPLLVTNTALKELA